MARKVYEMAFELAGKMNSSFGRTFSSANNKLQRMSRQISSLRTDIRQLERAQKKGEISVEEYSRAYEELTRKLKQAERAQLKYNRAIKAQERMTNFRNRMRGSMMGAFETAVTVSAPVAVAMRMESSMADVKKVVDFDTPEQFKAMEKDIINLSKRIPMAADGLAQIVAAGGQAGIARKDLVKFAEAAAKMGVAFDITADEAGQMMAQWRSAFKMNQDQVNTLADQINYLGNTTAASAPKISEVVRRIGPLGEVGGAAAAEIAALGATMVSAGVQEEIAATGIKNLILSMTAGKAATKSQQEAFKALGLDASNMAKMMQEDAQVAILQVMGALRKLPKHTQAAVMSDLFGKESIAAISPLLTNMDALEANLKKVGDSSQYAGSMQKEFESQAETTANQLILLKNHVFAVGKTVGDVLLPHIVVLAEKFSTVANKIQAFAERHPGFTKALVVGTSAVLGFTVALSGLLYIGSIIVSPFVSFYSWIRKLTIAEVTSTAATKKATLAQRAWNLAKAAGQKLLSVGRLVAYHAKMLVISAATKAWSVAQWLLNAAMNANPIGLVIAGVAALAGGLVLLYKKSETARKIMNAMWRGMKSGAQTAINFIIDNINGLIGALNKIKIPDWVPGIGGKGINISTIPKVNFTGDKGVSLAMRGYAQGGIATSPAIFGEAGPEMAIPLKKSKRSIFLWEMTGKLLGITKITKDKSNNYSTDDRFNNKKMQIKVPNWFNKIQSILDKIPGKNVAFNIGVLPVFAKGGIATSPSIFGEAGPEMAIPLDGSQRSVGLWAKAGEMLGIERDVGPYIGKVVFAPVIHGTNKSEIISELEKQQQKLVALIENIIEGKTRQEGRLSFA